MQNQSTNNQWNWGAFLLCPFWCIRYQVWIGMISTLPVILALVMSLISFCSFSLLVLTLKIKSSFPLSNVILLVLFCLLFMSGGVFLSLGKNVTMIGLTFFYIITSIFMGLKGDRLALRKINKEQDIKKFYSEKRNWLLLGLFFVMPLNIVFFCLTEKLVSISINLVQLPGI